MIIMKKLKILSAFLSLFILTGCGNISFEITKGEGFEETTYTDPFETVYEETKEDNETEQEHKSIISFIAPGEDEDNEDTYYEESSRENYEEENKSNITEEGSSVFEEIYGGEEEIETQGEESAPLYEEYSESSIDSDTSWNGAEEEIVTESVTEEAVDIYTVPYSSTWNIDDTIKNMSLEEKAAQVLLVRCTGNDAASVMKNYNFGGYTLYAVDFEDKTYDSAKSFISDIKSSAKITPFIAVDEEGGNVVRVSKFTSFRDTPFDSNLNIYKTSGLDGISENAKEKAKLLTDLGINLNLAPVCDIANEGDYIYNRTFGTDAENTGNAAKEIVNVSGKYGLLSCLKHFPGYGSNVDTHTGIAVDERSLESFRNNDFIPFEIGIQGDYLPAILVNHNIVKCMDESTPASLSVNVHKILREEIGFKGVIITDDLGMDGIKAYTGKISPYVMGLISGNDLLCVSDPYTAYNDILSALSDGTLSEDIIDEHIVRILKMKENMK